MIFAHDEMMSVIEKRICVASNSWIPIKVKKSPPLCDLHLETFFVIVQSQLPNVYRFWHLNKKFPKNVGDLDKLLVARGFKKLPKVQ